MDAFPPFLSAYLFEFLGLVVRFPVMRPRALRSSFFAKGTTLLSHFPLILSVLIGPVTLGVRGESPKARRHFFIV